jgi:transitional endoplasmic reticulum ATPase
MSYFSTIVFEISLHKEILKIAERKDINTVIMDCKNSPNRLVVDDARTDDKAVEILNPTNMEECCLFGGDTILLKGKKAKDTICIVLSNDEMDDVNIRMSNVREEQWCRKGCCI